MSNGTSNEDKEKVKPQEEEGFTNIVERFGDIIRKFKVKNAEMVADHCAKGNLEDLEDVEARMREMGVHPSLVTQVVNFWADEIQHPIPKRLRQKMEREAGARKKDVEEETDRIYFVDPETGIIRQAFEKEKATTLAEAKELQKLVKRDLEEQRKRREAEGEGKETAFILGEEGAWTLNPKAKIGFGEFAVFQMYQDSLRKGEPIDPIEEMARREESSARLREAMGGRGKGEDTELSTLDKLNALGMLRKAGEEGGAPQMLQTLSELGIIKKPGEEGGAPQMLQTLSELGIIKKPGEEGGTLQTLQTLSELGIIKKPGEEGGTSQADLIARLDSLGMLRKPGEEEGASSQIIRDLETRVKELTEHIRSQEIEGLKGTIVSLYKEISNVRQEMTSQTSLEGRYALLEKAMETVDAQLTGIRSDIKPIIMSASSGRSAEPRKREPEDKAKVAKSLKRAVEEEKAAKNLEDQLFFSSPED